MKKIKRTIAAMTAGLLCLAGTPTLPAEIQRTILLNANAADDVEADENAWYLKQGRGPISKDGVVLTPGTPWKLSCYCYQQNETEYSSLDYDEISQYVKINPGYDESIIQIDEETGYIIPIEGKGGTTRLTIEDTQGNTQWFTIRVLGEDPEIIFVNFNGQPSGYLSSSVLTLSEGESCYVTFDYSTGAPDYWYVSNSYSPDLFYVENHNGGGLADQDNIIRFNTITFDMNTGEIRANDSGDPSKSNGEYFSLVNSHNESNFSHEIHLSVNFTEQQTTSETTTTMMTTTATQTTTQPITTESTMMTTTATQTTTQPITTESTMMTTTAMQTTTQPITTETKTTTTMMATTTTIPLTTTMMTTTETTQTTTQPVATETTTEEPVETTTLVITEETTAQATTEELIETTVQETTEEPIATTETTPEATDDPNNEENLPETGTTGMPPARIAEYFALMLTIAGAGMITKSRKKEE